MKYIFLVEDPIPTTTQIKLPQLPYFSEKFHTCAVWDVRFICGLEKGQRKNLEVDSTIEFKTFYTKEAFEKQVSEEGKVIYISNYKLRHNNLFIYKVLRKYNVHYVVRKNKAHFLADQAAELRYRKKTPILYIINKLYTSFNTYYFRNHPGINPPYATFFGTDLDKKSHNFPLRKTHIYYTHALDFEKIINQAQPSISDTGIVFIDQYLPYHPETKKEGINGENYYTSINCFLHALAEYTNKKVTVALHPRCDEDVSKGCFDKAFDCRMGETDQLIKNASIVVGHMSSALSLAIIYKKPMLLITNDELDKTSINRINKKLAEVFEKSLYNIDNPIAFEQILQEMNSANHDRLFERFIKVKKSAHESEWVTLINSTQHAY